MYPVISIGPIEIESYKFFYLLAFIILALLLKREFEKRHYSQKLFLGVFITGLLFGMIGSKVYYILADWDAFILDPYQTFFNRSGSGWYGGLIFGGIGILSFLKIKKLPVLKFFDILALFIPLGQVFGRLGCFCAGCCHGTPSNLPWACAFPHGLYAPHVKVHPTQFYEVIIYLTIFILLLRLKNKNLKAGMVLGLYLVLAGLGRFIVEFYRPNPEIIAHLTAPQIFAFIGILFGGYFIFCTSQSLYPANRIAEEPHKPLSG